MGKVFILPSGFFKVNKVFSEKGLPMAISAEYENNSILASFDRPWELEIVTRGAFKFVYKQSEREEATQSLNKITDFIKSLGITQEEAIEMFSKNLKKPKSPKK